MELCLSYLCITLVADILAAFIIWRKSRGWALVLFLFALLVFLAMIMSMTMMSVAF